MTLTQKETTLLQELISYEEHCIEKYAEYEKSALDTQLKNLFAQLGQIEKQHLNTLNQILSGTVPNVGGSGGSSGSGGGGSQNQASATPTYTPINNDTNKQKDKYLCFDQLSTEKHVSGTYDTCIFEFKDMGIRNVLNHIQKEEQEHGQKIYSYMEQNGMYN